MIPSWKKLIVKRDYYNELYRQYKDEKLENLIDELSTLKNMTAGAHWAIYFKNSTNVYCMRCAGKIYEAFDIRECIIMGICYIKSQRRTVGNKYTMH